MKKKILALCLVLALAVTAIGGATLAYFTDTTQTENNTFTVGKVDITLTEPNWNDEEHDDLYPGEALAKNPTVKNDGDNPCFVRVKVTGWECLGANNKIIYRTDYVDNKLGDGWVYNEADDYFYYTSPLAVDATTDALFDQIVIPTSVTNGFEGNYSLDVTAYAVQAQGAKAPNWAAVQGMTVPEIAAWFTTCGM